MEMTHPIPVRDTYMDYVGWIRKLVSDFHRKWGGHYDELFCEANHAFIKAYQAFDPGEGNQFTTLLALAVKRRLADVRGAELRRARQARSLDTVNHDGKCLATQIPNREQRQFNVDDLLEKVSEDGVAVLNLVFDAPADLKRKAILKGGTGQNWMSTIRQHLRSEGWSSDRIRETFEEIRQVL